MVRRAQNKNREAPKEKIRDNEMKQTSSIYTLNAFFSR